MYLLLSPAKNLDTRTPIPALGTSLPECMDDAAALMAILKMLSPPQLAKLMSVSDKLAVLNTERHAAWAPPFTPENARPAAFLFNGDVYAGLDAHSIAPAHWAYAQEHVGILSGLYGLLRPLDLIQPYRLEMGAALANDAGRDLYAFWRPKLGARIDQRAQGETIVNLASQEYFGAVDTSVLPEVITPIFQDEKNGQYKIISFYAKRARGLMARFAIDHEINAPEALQNFDAEGYAFCPAQSDSTRWVFRRSASGS